MAGIASVLYGVFAYLLFLGTFLYAIAFVGNLPVPKTMVAFTRDGGKYVVVLNFKGGSWEHYDVGVRGKYQELANTSWPVFNLGNYPERTRGGDRAYDIVDVLVPAYGAVVLVRWD